MLRLIASKNAAVVACSPDGDGAGRPARVGSHQLPSEQPQALCGCRRGDASWRCAAASATRLARAGRSLGTAHLFLNRRFALSLSTGALLAKWQASVARPCLR